MSKPWIAFAAIGTIVAAALAWLAYSERTREISGVWLYQFEGSNFFEGATAATVRSRNLGNAGWLNYYEQPILARRLSHGYDDSGCWRVTAFELRFIGRRIRGLSGHLGGWNSRYEIDKLIEGKPLPWPDCDSPYDWDKD